MILKREIEQFAEKQNVPKSVIDKDWVLGHFIDAIYHNSECRKSLVFKGGTCLKKCYYPDYRFSEDLDFTSIDEDFELHRSLLNKISKFITQNAEIPMHIQQLKSLRYQEQLTGYKAVVKFWGADHSRNQPPPPPERWTSSIKIEIILYERMLFNIEERKVDHPYTDELSEGDLYVPCYSLNEMLSKKLRALIQRSYTAPRDYYDIWYLSQNETGINWEEVVQAFHKKMAFKGLQFTGIEQMINPENDQRLGTAWKNSLGHQIAEDKLPEYNRVRKDIIDLFNKVF